MDELIKERQRFEQAKGHRVAQSHDRLPNTAATCEDPPWHIHPTATEDIVRLIRRELEAMSPAPPIRSDFRDNMPSVTLNQAVIREEIASLGMPSLCSVRQTNTYLVQSASIALVLDTWPVTAAVALHHLPGASLLVTTNNCRMVLLSRPTRRTRAPSPTISSQDLATPRLHKVVGHVHRSSFPCTTGRFPSGN